MNRDTICVQGGYTPGNGEPRQIPIIQSTTFKYATSEDMGKLFDLEADGYFYSRLQNPTCDLVAKKICELEGGTAAMLTSSGQAANFFAPVSYTHLVLEVEKGATKFNTSELKEIPKGFKLDTLGDIAINKFKNVTVYVSRK